MADESERSALVRAWFANGDEDIDSCEGLLEARPERTVAIAFHAQQAVEKYLKALLIHHGLVPPRTHNIAALVADLPEASRDRALAISGINAVTVFAVEQRYAVFEDRPSHAVALEAHRIAVEVRALLVSTVPSLSAL